MSIGVSLQKLFSLRIGFVFWLEVPVLVPEICGTLFFWLSPFLCFSPEGFRKFSPDVSNIRSRKIWLSLFAFFSLEGLRKFSPEISGDRKFRPLTPEVPASRGCNGQILGEAINSLLLPQEEAAHSIPLSSIV